MEHREVQQIELSIMKEVHRYCVENSFLYVLSYGSLLGGVRHKGFIPWDNDMDICMPRPDFERFLKAVEENPISENLEALYWDRNNKYHYSVIRIIDKRTIVTPSYIREQIPGMGIWVDIYPVDGIVQSKAKRKMQFLLMKIVKKLQVFDIYGVTDSNPSKLKVKELIIKPFLTKKNFHARKLDKLAQWADYEKSEEVTTMVEMDNPPIRMTRKDFDSSALLEFEGIEFFVPFDSDGYLKQAYGDYMTPPPENLRVPPHDIHADWK